VNLGIEQVRAAQVLEHPVVDHAGGGLVAEQVVDVAAISKAALYPWRITEAIHLGFNHARAKTPCAASSARSRTRTFSGLAVSPKYAAGFLAGESTDRGDHAPWKLEIVVAIEDVVLAVVPDSAPPPPPCASRRLKGAGAGTPKSRWV